MTSVIGVCFALASGSQISDVSFSSESDRFYPNFRRNLEARGWSDTDVLSLSVLVDCGQERAVELTARDSLNTGRFRTASHGEVLGLGVWSTMAEVDCSGWS